MTAKVILKIIVNGQAASFEVEERTPVHALISRALAETSNTGQPPENWQLRDSTGNLLDPSGRVMDYNLVDGVTLFLSPKAGVGGCD